MDEMVNLTVQMPLSEQDLRALKHTRGRRRLRDVEAKCPPGVLLKLNKDYGDYGVLEISGPAEKVQMAQKRVEECTGPIKELSSAVWYELLRTRKGFGALNLIQKLTGCRLHLERNASQVRLLGSAHAAAWASALIGNLEEMCVEARVPAELLSIKPDQKLLSRIACQTSVTLCFQESELCVMGFRAAVHNAMAEMQRLVRLARFGANLSDLVDVDFPSNSMEQEVQNLAPLLPLAHEWASCPHFNPVKSS